MPIWPFNRKRRAATVNDPATEPLTEKFQSAATTRRTSTDALPTFAGKMSAKSSVRRGNLSQPQPVPPLDADDAPPLPPPLTRPPMSSNKSADKPKTGTSAEKENVRPRTHHSSVENITALPVSRRLESSPHLRAVDLERPVAAIPYSVRPYSKSQTSVQRTETVGSTGRPRTLRSKKSVNDAASIPRRQSTKKRRNDQVREEEIRAMSSTMPVPPRPGTVSDSPLLRKESTKKARGVSGKSSLVSLPPAEPSIHSSTLSGITEQRGWEIGMGAAFTPRPVVRLSGTPQYVSPSSAPGVSSYMTRELSRREEKAPASRSSGKKRQTVGNRVDDLDTAELRMILERDAKRKERKKVEQQEKLDKKLRSRGGRNRGDSDRSQRRREAAEALERAHETNPMPTTLHPALRDHRAGEEVALAAAGVGIAGRELGQGTTTTTETRRFEGPVPVENPFADPPAPEQLAVAIPTSDDMREAPAPLSLVATPMEEEEQPILGIAEAVSMSQPPISPVDSNTRTPQGFSPVESPSDSRPVCELVPPPAVIALDRKRASEPPREASQSLRRGAGGPGGWTSFFRRSTHRRPPNDESSEAGNRSFSNTSRESMRGQPIPAHLLDTTSQSATTTRSSSTVQRRRSETPVSRTQSRFREDLPESLLQGRELADSRIPSPDVTTAAALAAAARRSNGAGGVGTGTAGVAGAGAGDVSEVMATQPMDVPSASHTVTSTPAAAGASTGTPRGDVPVSPTIRGHGMMSASLASIDSEGSWLAGGPGSAKRQSTQSGIGRNLSLRKQQQLQLQQQSGAGTGAGGSGLGLGSATSYENLGLDGAGGSVDRDAEYFRRGTAAATGSPASPGSPVGERPSDQALLAHHQHQQQQMMLQRQLSLSSQQRRQQQQLQQSTQQQQQQETLSATAATSDANALRLSSGTTGATSVEGDDAAAAAAGSDRRESDLDTAPPVLDSIVRRRPTLVHRTEPRVKSREGLLAEYSAEFGGSSSAGPGTPFDDESDRHIGGGGDSVGGNVGGVTAVAPLDDLRTVSLQQLSGQPVTTATTSAPAYTTSAQQAQSYTTEHEHDDDDDNDDEDDTATTDIDDEEDDSDMHRATSISYQRERGHVRQISAGSARLLDVSRGGGAGGSVPHSPVDAGAGGVSAGTSAPVSPVDYAGAGASVHARTGSGAGLFSRGLEEILGRKDDEEGGS